MPMSTLRNPEQRVEILRRLRTLKPEAPRLWGTLDAPRMLCHISDALRVAVGDLEAPDAGNAFTRTVARWLVIDTPMQPPPGRIRTSPAMLSSSPRDWDEDLAACATLIERVGRGEGRGRHPAFGSLDPERWGRLSWKHLDHHLRQFGR